MKIRSSINKYIFCIMLLLFAACKKDQTHNVDGIGVGLNSFIVSYNDIITHGEVPTIDSVLSKLEDNEERNIRDGLVAFNDDQSTWHGEYWVLAVKYNDKYLILMNTGAQVVTDSVPNIRSHQ